MIDGAAAMGRHLHQGHAMFRFLHTADIHLDSPLRGLESYPDAPVEEIRGASRRAFDQLIALAIAEEVSFVLIVGDLYDGDWRDYNTGLFFTSRMGRLERAGIKVFVVSGNHDATSQITRTMPLPANVTLFPARQATTVFIPEIAVALHGQSYASRTTLDNLSLGYPAPCPGHCNIGLLHTSLTGRPGHEPYAPCSVVDLQSKGYEYWALGHIHQREIVSQDPWIVFPGNLQGRTIRETGRKGASLVEVRDGRIASVSERPLDVLRWANCTVDLTACHHPEAVYDQVRAALATEIDLAEGRPLVLRLHLHGPSALHGDLIGRQLAWTEELRGVAAGSGSVWLEKVRFQTESPGQGPPVGDDDSPLAGLLERINQLDFSAEALPTLVPEYLSLRAHLPVDLGHDHLAILADPESLADLRDQVRDLLVSRLIGPNPAP